MTSQLLRSSRRLAVLIVVLLLTASGCGSKTATVKGTVRYRNRTLPTGTVSFYCANGEIISALIGADGSYQVPRLAPGPARVAVISHSHVPQGLQVSQPPLVRAPAANPSGAGRVPSNAIPTQFATPIPEKYNRPDSSGLAFVLNVGEQTLDIDLEQPGR